jgi:hypothetical protein
MPVELSVADRAALEVQLGRPPVASSLRAEYRRMEAVWAAARDHYRAGSEVSVRMLADALKELADWASRIIEGDGEGQIVIDGRRVLGEARAALDALNEPGSGTGRQEEEVYGAFIAGFMESAEGCNAEYPHDGDRDSIEAVLAPHYKEWRGAKREDCPAEPVETQGQAS